MNVLVIMLNFATPVYWPFLKVNLCRPFPHVEEKLMVQSSNPSVT